MMKIQETFASVSAIYAGTNTSQAHCADVRESALSQSALTSILRAHAQMAAQLQPMPNNLRVVGPQWRYDSTTAEMCQDDAAPDYFAITRDVSA